MLDTPDRLRVEIAPDPDPIDPRAEYDHFGRPSAHGSEGRRAEAKHARSKMVCWHRRYDLGDPHDWSSPGDFRAAMPDKAIVKLPLFLYNHSGLTLSTEPFSCPWDSGQIGWIFRERVEILREFSRKRMSESLRSRVFSILRAEVAEYDAFIRGDVWTITVTDIAGAIQDSVSGVIGYDAALAEAQAMLKDAS